MSPKSSITIATCLPIVYFGYLQSTIATYSPLYLPVFYFSYLQSTIATWLTVPVEISHSRVSRHIGIVTLVRVSAGLDDWICCSSLSLPE